MRKGRIGGGYRQADVNQSSWRDHSSAGMNGLKLVGSALVGWMCEGGMPVAGEPDNPNTCDSRRRWKTGPAGRSGQFALVEPHRRDKG